MFRLPERVQLLVVGGGLAGASTAYHLARAGARDVLIVERESICGYHASGRNAALCRQLAEDDAVTAFTAAGAGFLREPPAGFADTPLLRRTGSCLLGSTDAQVEQIAARAAAWQIAHERISVAGLVQRWPRLRSIAAAGGVYFPGDGVIDVHALLGGFLAGARAGDTLLRLRCTVQRMAANGPSEVRVTTSIGEVRARAVVLAAGAWAGQLGQEAGSRQPPLSAIQRHLFVSQALTDVDADQPYVWHLGEEEEFYVRPEGAAYLFSGCDETEVTPCDAQVMSGAVSAAARKLTRVAPGLAELGVARAWACLRTFAPDRRFVLGWDPVQPWLFWVAGLGGHGATAAAAVGEAAAAQIIGRLGPG